MCTKQFLQQRKMSLPEACAGGGAHLGAVARPVDLPVMVDLLHDVHVAYAACRANAAHLHPAC